MLTRRSRWRLCCGVSEADAAAATHAAATVASGAPRSPAPTASQDLRTPLLQSCSHGSLLEKLRALPRACAAANAHAELYAVINDPDTREASFVLLTEPPAAAPGAATTRAPVQLLTRAVCTQVVVHDTWASGPSRVAVAAVPLIRAASNSGDGEVHAVLWLQQATQPQQQAQCMLQDEQQLQGVGSLLSALLIDDASLSGVSALGSHLARLHAATSLESLLRELSNGLASIVSQRFLVDAAVAPALVPDVGGRLAFHLELPPAPAAVAPTSTVLQRRPAGNVVLPPSVAAAAAAAEGPAAAEAADGSTAMMIESGTPPRRQQLRSTVVPMSAAPRVATTAADCAGAPGLLPAHATVTARAFKLQRTVLQGMLSAREQQQQQQQQQQNRAQQECVEAAASGAASAAASAPVCFGAVERGLVEDVLSFVQRPDSPAGDMCHLLEHVPARDGSTPRSLMTVLLPSLDKSAALVFYVYMQRVPARLLEAAQEACQNWLGFEAVRSCVLNKLGGPLAAELNTFRDGVAAGVYAVVLECSAPQPALHDTAMSNTITTLGTSSNGTGWRATAGEAPAAGDSFRDLCREQAMEPRPLSVEEAEAALQPWQLRFPLHRAHSNTAANEYGPAASRHFAQMASLLRSSPADLAAAAAGTAVSGTCSFLAVHDPQPLSSTLRRRMSVLLSSINETLCERGGAGQAACHYDDLDVLELLEVVGRGAFSVVLRGVMATSQEVAVKMLPVPTVTELVRRQTAGGGGKRTQGAAELESERATLQTALEIAVQQSVSHPNIVQMYALYRDVYEYEDAGGKRRLRKAVDAAAAEPEARGGGEPVVFNAIVTELCELGALGSALTRRTFPLPLDPAAAAAAAGGLPYELGGVCRTLLDVALALRHLHSRNLVHRDIKPANILLRANSRDPRGFTAKIADFGLCLQLKEVDADGTRFARTTSASGTVTHIPPEAYAEKRATAKADVFAFGMMMWELLSGGVRPFSPLQEKLIPHAVWRKCRPRFDQGVPTWYRALASACWAHEPHLRPTADRLVVVLSGQLQEMADYKQ